MHERERERERGLHLAGDGQQGMLAECAKRSQLGEWIDGWLSVRVQGGEGVCVTEWRRDVSSKAVG